MQRSDHRLPAGGPGGQPGHGGEGMRRIQARDRFVHDQEIGPAHHGAGQHGAGKFAARQGGDRLFALLG